MPQSSQCLLPLLGVVMLTIGCNTNAPPRNVVIDDFTHPDGDESWKPEQMFADPGLAEMAGAIQAGNLEGIRQSLANNVPIDGVGQRGVTPLAWAYIVRNKQAFRYLLEKNANPNVFFYKRPLMIIIAENEEDSEWLGLTLSHGGDPNIESQSTDILYGKHTPIFGAIDSRRKESLDLLIKAGADLNHQVTSGNTPAMYAAVRSRFDLVYCLIEAGADADIREANGRSLALKVMVNAVASGKERDEWIDKILTLLEQKGIDLETEAGKIPMKDDRKRWLERIKARKNATTTNER